MPNSPHFNFPPLAAVAPTTTGPAAAVRNYFKRPLARRRGAFKLFKDDIKTPCSTPLTNMSHQGNKYTFFSPQHAVSCPDAVVHDSSHANSEQHTGKDCLLRKRLNIVPFILPQEAEFGLIVKLPDKSAKAVFWCRVVCAPFYNRNGKEKITVQCRCLTCFQHVVPPALVKGVYLDAMVCVLLQDLLGVFVCVEGVHEDQGHVGVVRLVQVL